MDDICTECFECIKCPQAAKRGHVGCLQLLRWQRAPWSSACEVAAENGQLEILKWAFGDGNCNQWGVEICAAAARGGHVHIIRWLRNHPIPCPWNELTTLAAAEKGHTALLEWVLIRGCPVAPTEKATLRLRSQLVCRLCFKVALRLERPNTRGAGRALDGMKAMPPDIVNVIASLM